MGWGKNADCDCVCPFSVQLLLTPSTSACSVALLWVWVLKARPCSLLILYVVITSVVGLAGMWGLASSCDLGGDENKSSPQVSCYCSSPITQQLTLSTKTLHKKLVKWTPAALPSAEACVSMSPLHVVC